MLVTSGDDSEKDPIEQTEFAESVAFPGEDVQDELAFGNLQPHFARVYMQRDEAITRDYYTNPLSAPSFKSRVQRWLLLNTFAPQWLPKLLQHTFVSYIIAVLLQIVAIALVMLLLHLFPTFVFPSVLLVFAIAFTAISFGTGPGICATVVGLLLFDFFIRPMWSLDSGGNMQQTIENLLFLLVGVSMSVSASQVERARRSAYAERSLFNAVIETMPDSVSIYDAQGRLVRLNSVGRRVQHEQGYEPLNSSYTTGKLQTPSGQQVQQEQLPVTRALQGETVSTVELVWRDTTQETHTLSVSAAPLHDMWGHIGGAVTVSHDITSLRQSQQQTADSLSELEAVFEAMSDGVFVFDRKAKSFRMNAAFRALLGISASKDYVDSLLAEPRALFQFLDIDGQPLPREQWPQRRILRGETLKGDTMMDLVVHTVDGRDVIMSVGGSPIYTHTGELTGGVIICRDITERLSLERYTQETLQGLLAMAQTLVQGMYADDQIGEDEFDEVDEETLNAVEQRVAELTSHVLRCKRVGIIAIEEQTHRLIPVAASGLTPAQERLWWEHVPQMRPDTSPDILPLLERLRQGEVISLDVAQVPGAYLYTLFSSRSLLLAPMTLRSQFMGFLILDNEDEEHSYTSEEQVLAGTVAKLAALVIERKRLLRERAEARASEIALRDANERMNEFLNIASHELKTPVTTIKGSVQLLNRRLKKMLASSATQEEERVRLQHEAEDLLHRTDTQVSRLTRLIDDLLDVSRIQSKRLQLSMEPCDLEAVVRDAVRVQEQATPTRTVLLDMPPSSSIPVLADAGRIQQVLANYLSNALKYSALEKPVTVSVHLEPSVVRVSVHDEGIGIANEEQAHIWERFYRVPGATVQSGSGVGLGLGLYIAKMVIELHQGEVGMQSEPGKGSTFWFTLPLLGAQ